ncbi:MAG: peptidoglycan editing factor PgeF [Patescibacteria group bacterium]
MEKQIFRNDQGLIFGLSKVSDGDMKLHKSDKHSEADINRLNLFLRLGIDPKKVVSVFSAHGTKITKADSRNQGCIVTNSDGLITNVSGTTLAISVADCAPLYLFDSRLRVIALLHCGWRGTAAKVVKLGIEKMADEYGSRSKDIQAFIGPRIRSCHFEVGPDVAAKFNPADVGKRDNKYYVNLGGAIKRQLLSAGLSAENIKISEVCTYCGEEYFSHRRDKHSRVKAGLAYLGMEF